MQHEGGESKKYKWSEIKKILDNGFERCNLPEFISLRQDKEFILTTVDIRKINKDSCISLKDCLEKEYIDTYNKIHSLVNAYCCKEAIPPIVLDKYYNLIDGSHRLSALIELQREEILAFVAI